MSLTSRIIHALFNSRVEVESLRSCELTDSVVSRDSVRQVYSHLAAAPEGEHPFATGRAMAESAGYSADLLDSLPALSVDAFAGVSNVGAFADIPAGARVLDIGCGAGLDSLIAARKVGPDGCVIGIDFSDTMLERAQRAALVASIENVEFRRADAEEIPIDDESVDLVLVNGLFNLNSDRTKIFAEIARVLKPGGSIFASELIVREPLPEEFLNDPANWFA